ncbi:MAG: hypothetical protein RIS00_1423 [Pseudomonadota bacterium]|jgi:hypothetical protein
MVATKWCIAHICAASPETKTTACRRLDIGMLLRVMVPAERLLDHMVRALERRI